MKIIVLGANGFLGSWICRVLSINHQVFGFIRKESSSINLSDLKEVKLISYVEEDLYTIACALDCEVLILADWNGVQNFERNSHAQQRNVERTKNRLRFIKLFPVVIGMGSQAEVGPCRDQISEDIDDNPTSLYGKAKVETRKLLRQELNLNRTRFVWARVFSTYGPLDSHSWFIPSLIHSMTNNAVFEMTKGEQEWSFLHAYDLARAFELLVQTDVEDIVNVGNPLTYKLLDIANAVADKFGRRNLLKVGAIPYRTDQVMRLAPITEKLSKKGWNPMVDLDSGIDHLIHWMRGATRPILEINDGTSFESNLPRYIPRK